MAADGARRAPFHYAVDATPGSAFKVESGYVVEGACGLIGRFIRMGAGSILLAAETYPGCEHERARDRDREREVEQDLERDQVKRPSGYSWIIRR